MATLIIDYGMSNLGSIKRSIEECLGDVVVSDDPRAVKSASRIILPGVGTFADGMANLHKMGWVCAIQEAVQNERVPLLGICLGMQLLASKGYEGGEVSGLGFIPGEVKRLEPNAPSVRIPHVGWNEVYGTSSNGLFDGIPEGSDFYFVHSYHLIPDDTDHILATTPYCNQFISAVVSGNVFGVQFHPEKSGRVGFQLLKNFLKI